MVAIASTKTSTEPISSETEVSVITADRPEITVSYPGHDDTTDTAGARRPTDPRHGKFVVPPTTGTTSGPRATVRRSSVSPPREPAVAGLVPAELEWLTAACKACNDRRIPAGQHLFRAGSVPTSVDIIVEGTVAISRARMGRRTIVSMLHKGAILGDVPLLCRTEAAFDAVALTDVRTISVPAARFIAGIAEVPSLATHWVLWSARRLAAMQNRVAELLAGDLRSQIASVLLDEVHGQRAVVLTQQALSDMVGAQRTSVNRVLRELSALGAIEIGYGRIAVRDRQRLCTIALGEPESLMGTGA